MDNHRYDHECQCQQCSNRELELKLVLIEDKAKDKRYEELKRVNALFSVRVK